MHPELGSVCQEDGLGVVGFSGACVAVSGEVQFRGAAWRQGDCTLLQWRWRDGAGLLLSLGPISPNPTAKFKWPVYSEKQGVRMWGSSTGECVRERAHPTGCPLPVPHPGSGQTISYHRTSRQPALSEEFTPN